MSAAAVGLDELDTHSYQHAPVAGDGGGDFMRPAVGLSDRAYVWCCGVRARQYHALMTKNWLLVQRRWTAPLVAFVMPVFAVAILWAATKGDSLGGADPFAVNAGAVTDP